MIQNESRDPNDGNVYYATVQITLLTRKFRNVERNLHYDVVHITIVWVSRITLDCNGIFAIKAYVGLYRDVWVAAIASSRTRVTTLSWVCMYMYVYTLFSDGKNLVTKVIFPRAVLLVKVSIIICTLIIKYL